MNKALFWDVKMDEIDPIKVVNQKGCPVGKFRRYSKHPQALCVVRNHRDCQVQKPT